MKKRLKETVPEYPVRPLSRCCIVYFQPNEKKRRPKDRDVTLIIMMNTKDDETQIWTLIKCHLGKWHIQKDKYSGTTRNDQEHRPEKPRTSKTNCRRCPIYHITYRWNLLPIIIKLISLCNVFFRKQISQRKQQSAQAAHVVRSFFFVCFFIFTVHHSSFVTFMPLTLAFFLFGWNKIIYFRKDFEGNRVIPGTIHSMSWIPPSCYSGR